MDLITDLLNATVAVSRRQTVSDGSGGQTSVWAPVGTYQARLSQPTDSEGVSADQEEQRITGQVYFDSDVPIQRGDRLAVDDRQLEVLAVLVPSEPIYRRADCRDIQAGT